MSSKDNCVHFNPDSLAINIEKLPIQEWTFMPSISILEIQTIKYKWTICLKAEGFTKVNFPYRKKIFKAHPKGIIRPAETAWFKVLTEYFFHRNSWKNKWISSRRVHDLSIKIFSIILRTSNLFNTSGTFSDCLSTWKIR